MYKIYHVNVVTLQYPEAESKAIKSFIALMTFSLVGLNYGISDAISLPRNFTFNKTSLLWLGL